MLERKLVKIARLELLCYSEVHSDFIKRLKRKKKRVSDVRVLVSFISLFVNF